MEYFLMVLALICTRWEVHDVGGFRLDEEAFSSPLEVHVSVLAILSSLRYWMRTSYRRATYHNYTSLYMTMCSWYFDSVSLEESDE